jgi:hypothetical protein
MAQSWRGVTQVMEVQRLLVTVSNITSVTVKVNDIRYNMNNVTSVGITVLLQEQV